MKLYILLKYVWKHDGKRRNEQFPYLPPYFQMMTSILRHIQQICSRRKHWGNYLYLLGENTLWHSKRRNGSLWTISRLAKNSFISCLLHWDKMRLHVRKEQVYIVEYYLSEWCWIWTWLPWVSPHWNWWTLWIPLRLHLTVWIKKKKTINCKHFIKFKIRPFLKHLQQDYFLKHWCKRRNSNFSICNSVFNSV